MVSLVRPFMSELDEDQLRAWPMVRLQDGLHITMDNMLKRLANGKLEHYVRRIGDPDSLIMGNESEISPEEVIRATEAMLAMRTPSEDVITQCCVHFHPVVSDCARMPFDLAEAIQSHSLSEDPIGNVHLFMGLSTASGGVRSTVKEACFVWLFPDQVYVVGSPAGDRAIRGSDRESSSPLRAFIPDSPRVCAMLCAGRDSAYFAPVARQLKSSLNVVFHSLNKSGSLGSTFVTEPSDGIQHIPSACCLAVVMWSWLLSTSTRWASIPAIVSPDVFVWRMLHARHLRQFTAILRDTPQRPQRFPKVYFDKVALIYGKIAIVDQAGLSTYVPPRPPETPTLAGPSQTPSA